MCPLRWNALHSNNSIVTTCLDNKDNSFVFSDYTAGGRWGGHTTYNLSTFFGSIFVHKIDRL